MHKGKADEFFPEQKGEDLMGEDFLDDLVLETTDTMHFFSPVLLILSSSQGPGARRPPLHITLRTTNSLYPLSLT